MYRFLCLFLFVLICTFPVSLLAQVTSGDISVELTPEIPGANQSVTIKLSSYSTDLNRASISWSVGSEEKMSGIGKTKFSTVSGPIGSKTTITATLILSSGDLITKKILLVPSELDILWEGADAYTPPFYRGRALPASEGLIRLVAVPASKSSATTGFVYTWKRNDQTQQEASGFGKNSILFRNSYITPKEEMEVTASGLRDGSVATASFIIDTFKPKILFYKDTDSFGIDRAHALNNTGLSFGSDAYARIVAEPFFFSPNNPRSLDLTYNWKVNGKQISTPETKNVLFFQKSGSSGSANIDLSITSVSKLFLEATTKLMVNL